MEAYEKIQAPLVAIRCTAFNHAPYIKDALEGFVMQKTNFPFVAIVHDDASTDGTQKIIEEYAKKYPEIIKPLYEKENQYNKKDGSIRKIMDEACKETGAKYIALCEGDDYWTDPYKLQKQVDLMETHPDIVYSCHNYITIKDNYCESPKLPDFLFRNKWVRFTLKEAFSSNWFTKTLTCLFRADKYFDIDFSIFNAPRDIHLVYSILRKGDGIFLNEICGTYRIHPGGIWAGLNSSEQFLENYKHWQDIHENAPTKISKRYFYSIYYSYLILLIKGEKLPKLPWSFFKFSMCLKLPFYLIKNKFTKIQ